MLRSEPHKVRYKKIWYRTNHKEEARLLEGKAIVEISQRSLRNIRIIRTYCPGEPWSPQLYHRIKNIKAEVHDYQRADSDLDVASMGQEFEFMSRSEPGGSSDSRKVVEAGCSFSDTRSETSVALTSRWR